MAMTKSKKPLKKGKNGVVMLSGGNPQIPMGDGDAPVQAYLNALEGWKQAAAKRFHALVEKAVPQATKAVKWNSPMYGIEGQGFFVSMHAFPKYMKVTFFRGTSLKPMPPIDSKVAGTRYLHLEEDGAWDEAQFVAWLKQAAKVPGWVP